MSTSKPPRQRPHMAAAPTKRATRYQPAPPETYANLDPLERRRHDAHLDIDSIYDAIPLAELDRDSIGFPTDYRLSDTNTRGGLGVIAGDGGEDEAQLNTVEAAALSRRVDTATDWLANSLEARSALTVTARTARNIWPPALRAGTKVAGLTVGGKTDNADTCPWCNEPVVSGRNEDTGRPLAHRVDDWLLHAEPCYQQVYRGAKKAGIGNLGTYITNSRQQKEASPGVSLG